MNKKCVIWRLGSPKWFGGKPRGYKALIPFDKPRPFSFFTDNQEKFNIIAKTLVTVAFMLLT